MTGRLPTGLLLLLLVSQVLLLLAHAQHVLRVALPPAEPLLPLWLGDCWRLPLELPAPLYGFGDCWAYSCCCWLELGRGGCCWSVLRLGDCGTPPCGGCMTLLAADADAAEELVPPALLLLLPAPATVATVDEDDDEDEEEVEVPLPHVVSRRRRGRRRGLLLLLLLLAGAKLQVELIVRIVVRHDRGRAGRDLAGVGDGWRKADALQRHLVDGRDLVGLEVVALYGGWGGVRATVVRVEPDAGGLDVAVCATFRDVIPAIPPKHIAVVVVVVVVVSIVFLLSGPSSRLPSCCQEGVPI
uniref:Uncharacterized protein n=1 Tax=Anopheles atroparvus TaxID=41427 RepID=A0A182JDC5_ANOAO